MICQRCGQREASSNHVVGRIVYPPGDPRHAPAAAEPPVEPYLCEVCVSQIANEIIDLVSAEKRRQPGKRE
jgi:hypothetical protein